MMRALMTKTLFVLSILLLVLFLVPLSTTTRLLLVPRVSLLWLVGSLGRINRVFPTLPTLLKVLA
jgi:hypothetical protein